MLAPWNKSYNQSRQDIKKQRHYFANKSPSSQSYGFSSNHVWIWTIKKAKSQRTDAFELWCWRRLFRVPWTERRSNQSILNIHWRDWCWSWSSKSLATWCEEPTHWKWPWCWERSKAGREGDDRGWDGWMASLTWWPWVWTSSTSWWWMGKSSMLQSMGSQRVGHDWETELSWVSV